MSTARHRHLSAAALAVTLTAGVLVTATAPTATAGSGSTTYTCTMPVLGAVSVPVSTTVPDLPVTPAGAPVAAGALDPAFVFDTTSLATVLPLLTSPSVSGMALGVGEQAVPLQGFSFGPASGTSLPASATSSAFTAPATPGVHPVTMPEEFNLTALLAGSPVEAPCVSDAPDSLGTLTVLPGEGSGIIPSTTEATVVKKRIVKGKRARITVATLAGVDPLVQPAAGEVIVRKRKRTVGQGVLETGETVIRTKRFRKPGRYRLTVRYLGDAVTAPSSDRVVVRVVRRRR